MIREIQRGDNPALAYIIRTVLDEFDANREGFAATDPETDCMFEAYTSPRSKYFVLIINKEVVGGAGIGTLKGEIVDQLCELQKMYILPKARGQGHAKVLLNLCLEAAEQMGYTQCYLETLDRMNIAQNLYLKAGFKRIPKPLGNSGHNGCNIFMLRHHLLF